MDKVTVSKDLLNALIQYCEGPERKHYQDNPDKNHIYVTICKLRKEINK